jgi:hypothetical protein
VLGGLVLALVLCCATGCSLTKQPAQGAIDRVEAELELDDIGDVVCVSSDSPLFWQPQNPTKRFAVADVDSLAAIEARLEEIGFVQDPLSGPVPRLLFTNEDFVDLRLAQFGPEFGGTVQDNFGDCEIPSDGMVGVYLFA